MKCRIDYDPTPIRHIAIQCPHCEKWFYGRDITKDSLQFEYQLRFAEFKCPVCGETFGGDPEIEEVMHPDVYKDCLKKKEIWR